MPGLSAPPQRDAAHPRQLIPPWSPLPDPKVTPTGRGGGARGGCVLHCVCMQGGAAAPLPGSWGHSLQALHPGRRLTSNFSCFFEPGQKSLALSIFFSSPPVSPSVFSGGRATAGEANQHGEGQPPSLCPPERGVSMALSQLTGPGRHSAQRTSRSALDPKPAARRSG